MLLLSSLGRERSMLYGRIGHTEGQQQASIQQGRSMARPPKRKTDDATFRCLDEDGFLFTAKMEYVGHDAGEEEGPQVIEWVPGQASVTCPHDPTHRIELVEE
jgi:hypothetical protein